MTDIRRLRVAFQLVDGTSMNITSAVRAIEDTARIVPGAGRSYHPTPVMERAITDARSLALLDVKAAITALGSEHPATGGLVRAMHQLDAPKEGWEWLRYTRDQYLEPARELLKADVATADFLTPTAASEARVQQLLAALPRS